MTQIRRLALAAAAACLVAGKAWAPGGPVPFERINDIWDLIFNGLFLFGVIAAAYGIFRLAVRSAKRKYARENDITVCQVRISHPWQDERVIGRFVLYLVLLAGPAVIVVYFGSFFVTLLLYGLFNSWF